MRHPNRLADETSPYLQQHAHNPVEWYPWGPEALEKAREQNKPILLSIGYSACHWCHVMAHESFEDPDVARVMNELYVNIKVDREERPDLDKIYQTAFQLLNQRGGGWPLNVVLTPDDHTPFFAGTYFPKDARHGLPPFTEVLQKVEAFFREHETDIRQQNQALQEAMQQMQAGGGTGSGQLDSSPLDAARHQLAQNYDSTYGGFGQAPKFPHPSNLERLLHHWFSTARNGKPDQQARDMLRLTLHGMGSGGLYDQLGGGFYRYSVDDQWMIPHFEKMLYDNGPLLQLYTKAWQALGDSAFKRIALETGEWVIREMQSPEGGYYSTLDADSEGKEGKFYIWTPAQIKSLLSDDEYAVAAPHYGLDRNANFEGHWHLHVFTDLETIAEGLSISIDEAQQYLQSARRKLFAAREQRVRPGRDEKILTAWNGLMIKGMACAGRHLGRQDFIESAQRAAGFIHATLYHDQRLLATYIDGKAHLMAYLDDYAFMIDALLELLQAQWREQDLTFARQLAETLLAHFEDQDQGGFYFTADDHEQLFHRPKPTLDESTPAGNGVAASSLQRLGHLIGETRYLAAAERTLRMSWSGINQLPYAHCALLLALEEHLSPPQLIVLRGKTTSMAPWIERCNQAYSPARLCYAIPADARELPGLLAERPASEADVIAYPCSGMSCHSPVIRLEELESILKAEAIPGQE
ncbi:MAG: thioredoxin domain-containing protein [Thiohalophilus sp.]|uniref:thioredoxin domain-containing protein n=1 Tax=Thiohalophilus sp. TaxID=3028392 RepID=UPI002870588C|nr:thioredoxin domain-containing protein [Thiohalophilus sp.]MDR9435869.1 thioredoxin domain-containing protein [Thiohalophilus sp.]